MHIRRFEQGVRLVAAIGTALVLAACANVGTQATAGAASTAASPAKTTFGPSQPLGNGTAKTYVTLDATGQPTEVGLRLSATALDNLPQNTGPGDAIMLAFPDQAAGTPSNHVMLNWNPQGHTPVELFGKPHFDVHFDMVDMAAMQAINPDDPQFAAKAGHLPDPKYVPQDYVVPPGPPVAAQAVPGMGVHLLDSTDSTLAPGT
jgi:hypothetical protein